MLSAVFLTPLVYFTPTHDQFELPKLVFLGLTASMMLILSLTLRQKSFLGPLGAALLLLLAAQTVSSLPKISLSWQASLLGDYENFSGLATLLTYIACFLSFQAAFQSRQAEKPFFFISLSAFLSSLYAVAQHFGLDFVQWNPATVISTREFASLGNPNFLSAFLAMALPLWLAWLKIKGEKRASIPSPVWILALLLGLCFLFFGTAQDSNPFSGPTFPPAGTLPPGSSIVSGFWAYPFSRRAWCASFFHWVPGLESQPWLSWPWGWSAREAGEVFSRLSWDGLSILF